MLAGRGLGAGARHWGEECSTLPPCRRCTRCAEPGAGLRGSLSASLRCQGVAQCTRNQLDAWLFCGQVRRLSQLGEACLVVEEHQLQRWATSSGGNHWSNVQLLVCVSAASIARMAPQLLAGWYRRQSQQSGTRLPNCPCRQAVCCPSAVHQGIACAAAHPDSCTALAAMQHAKMEAQSTPTHLSLRDAALSRRSGGPAAVAQDWRPAGWLDEPLRPAPWYQCGLGAEHRSGRGASTVSPIPRARSLATANRNELIVDAGLGCGDGMSNGRPAGLIAHARAASGEPGAPDHSNGCASVTLLGGFRTQ